MFTRPCQFRRFRPWQIILFWKLSLGYYLKKFQRYRPLTRYVKLHVAHAPGMPGRSPRHHGFAIPTCITAPAWRTCPGACRDRWLAGKTFPAYPVQAQPAVLRIWQEVHGSRKPHVSMYGEIKMYPACINIFHSRLCLGHPSKTKSIFIHPINVFGFELLR